MQSGRVALLQIDSGADKVQNMDKIKDMIREAAAGGAEFVMLPETAEYIGEDMRGHASFRDGLEVFYASLARECGIWLQTGSMTEKTEGKPANLSMLISPSGTVKALYRKLHLFDVEVEDGPSCRESDEIEAGDAIVLANTALGVMGMSICYDIRFPQLYRLMSGHGAEILLVSANFTDVTGQAHWEPLLRARAIENSCYVLACDQCGEKPAFTAHGHSMVIDPWGQIVARAGQKETILYADLDAGLLEQCRRQVPSLKNAREDVYSLMAKKFRISMV